ncbi:MAG: hypothetical protein OCU24_00945 [Candidatus Methanospirare jalkutatii]|nr:hypothetical protein [Candidatus Methanospirare jalkutatii]
MSPFPFVRYDNPINAPAVKTSENFISSVIILDNNSIDEIAKKENIESASGR